MDAGGSARSDPSSQQKVTTTCDHAKENFHSSLPLSARRANVILMDGTGRAVQIAPSLRSFATGRLSNRFRLLKESWGGGGRRGTRKDSLCFNFCRNGMAPPPPEEGYETATGCRCVEHLCSLEPLFMNTISHRCDLYFCAGTYLSIYPSIFLLTTGYF